MEQLKDYDLFISRQVYYNPDNGFAVYRFLTETQLFDWQVATESFQKDWFTSDVKTMYEGTLSGNVGYLDIGVKYKVRATEAYVERYNTQQLKATSCVSIKPSTVEEQYTYLRSIISPTQAKQLLEVYPNIVEQIMTDNSFEPEYSKLKGIKHATFNKIKDKVINNYVLSEILIMLAPFNINNSTVQRLVKASGSASKLRDQLSYNPYLLTEYRGFGFASVDKIALQMNPKLIDSRFRLESFLKFYFTKIANDDGSCWISEEEFRNVVRANIPECKEEYNKLKEECIAGTEANDPTVLLRIKDNTVGLLKVYNMEKEIIERIHEIQDGISMVNYHPTLADCDDAIRLTNQQNGYSLTDMQCQSVRSLVTNNVNLIVGNAGTGKSSSIRAITNLYKDKTIVMCALSAKAAQRMREVTGLDAKTIHRTLGWNENGFSFNQDNKLDCDIVIIDEASMINVPLFLNLIRAIDKRTKLVIVYDNAQLPPIGMGNIASDLMNDKYLALHRLDKIHRQAQKSGILTDANAVRMGIFPIESFDDATTGELQDMHYYFFEEGDNQMTYTSICQKAIKLFKEALKDNDVNDVIIISPFRQNGINSTNTLNGILQDIVLPKAETVELLGRKFKRGAKIIQRKNNQAKDVVNGEIGYIDTFVYENGKVKEVIVRYDDNKYVKYSVLDTEQFDLAYALTVHSYQGSECKHVIICIDNSMMIMLDNCLLYTAITRAKQSCHIVAQPKAFIHCVTTNKAMARNTYSSVIIHDSK